MDGRVRKHCTFPKEADVRGKDVNRYREYRGPDGRRRGGRGGRRIKGRTGRREGGETRHPGLVRGRQRRLGVGLVSAGPRVQTDRGRGRRKQRSILSELGSYPRGHRTGLAQGESQRRRE